MNDCKNSKDISDPFSGVVGSVGSLPRWFPLFNLFCLLVSSVSDFRPDMGGGGGHFFFFFFLGSLVQSHCGEEGMLQTNSTVVCTQCLSPAGPAPARGAQTTQALCCSAGNRLRPALGCVHLPGLSRSGSALRLPSEAQIRLGLRFVPFPGPSSSGVWRARSLRFIAFPVSAAQLSGWTAGAPREADGDCPAPP